MRTRGVQLTVAINGYDDGASTGEVRRFLGDALGPSDFRKNASRLATELATCPPPLVALLDRRLPDDASAATVQELIDDLKRAPSRDVGLRELPAAARQAGMDRKNLWSFARKYRIDLKHLRDDKA